MMIVHCSLGKLSVIALLGFFASMASGQDLGSMSGRIVDSQTKQPIPLVNIVLRSTTYGAATDSAGHFEIRRLPSDLYIMEISHVAYKKRLHVHRLQPRENAVFSVELDPEVIEMEGVQVTANAEKPTKLQQSYASTVVTSAQIEHSGVRRLTDVLRSLIPASFDNPTPRRGRFPGTTLDRPPFLIYLDGAYVQYISGSLDQIVDITQIDRIEVSRWVGAAPNFGPGTSDRVLQIFTKRPKR
ncbi:MAG: TonB-dependent receptor [Ignavibacteria bacterium]|nr:TonB-dependent receptor [Ignavibacteria bacterium]